MYHIFLISENIIVVCDATNIMHNAIDIALDPDNIQSDAGLNEPGAPPAEYIIEHNAWNIMCN